MNLHYESYGAGEPLILIPGFASGAWIWYRQISELAKNFRVITFDPRGVANSKLSDELAHTFTVETIADDIAEILDDLILKKAHILGASFGGFVAQDFALRYPNRLHKLILACTTAGGKNHVKPDIEVLRSFSPDASLSLSERIRKFMRPAFTAEFNENHASEVEKVCRLREENIVPDAIYLAQLTAAFTFDADAKIHEITAETLVISGDKDFVVPMPNSENLARKIPNVRLEIVKNGSHLFFIENAEEFNNIVTRFLRGN